MSCHGCRALRKGCPDNCTIKTSVQWLHSPESQANATTFLTKFYGRTGLLNLLKAGPVHLRPEILRSLLYEACARKIDPLHGSVGLYGSGHWQRCEAAVESVLRFGEVQVPAGDNEFAPFLGHARVRTQTRGKRPAGPQVNFVDTAGSVAEPEAKFTVSGLDERKKYGENDDQEWKRGASDTSFSVEKQPNQDEKPAWEFKSELQSGENWLQLALPNWDEKSVSGFKPESQSGENWLDLTLGVNPMTQIYTSMVIDISEIET